STNAYLDDAAIREIVVQAAEAMPIAGKRVLVTIPDGTRTAPVPGMFRYFQELLCPQVKALDYLVALGTHPAMSDAQLSKLVGTRVVGGRVGETRIFNHQWDDPSVFVTLGSIPAHEISALTRGLMSRDVCVTINKLIFDYDHIIVCGPVFPHEVAGFS